MENNIWAWEAASKAQEITKIGQLEKEISELKAKNEELLNHLAWLTEYVDNFGFCQMFDPDISDTVLFAKTQDLISKYRG